MIAAKYFVPLATWLALLVSPAQSHAGHGDGVAVQTLRYGAGATASAEPKPLYLDLYRPEQRESAALPVLILVHGGGFIGGARNIDEQVAYGEAFARRGYAVISIDYRLAGDDPVVAHRYRSVVEAAAESRYPALAALRDEHGAQWTHAVGAAVEDIDRAVAWVRANAHDWSLDPERIAIVGASAGAVATVTRTYLADDFDFDPLPIRAVVAIRGMLLRPDEASVPQLEAEAPPLFIVHGIEDERVEMEEAERLQALAVAAGITSDLHLIRGFGHELGGTVLLESRSESGETMLDSIDGFLRNSGMDPSLSGREGPAIEAATGAEIVTAAHALLASVPETPGAVDRLYEISPRDRLAFPFDSERREAWSYWPRERERLSLRQMNAEQRRLVHRLLTSFLSAKGYLKVFQIMQLEDFLRVLDTRGFRRGSDEYGVAIFGEPSTTRPWAMRFEGHHVSLNLTLLPGNRFNVTPSFLGSSPAEIASGPSAGLRILYRESDLALRLMGSLNADQRDLALLSAEAPMEVLSSPFSLPPEDHDDWRETLHDTGLPVASLDAEQRRLFDALLEEIVTTYNADIAASSLADIRAQTLHFAWMGGLEPGEPIYYRITGESFVFEYDNAQEDGNHIHTVWRGRHDDFGADMLARHYRESAHHRHDDE